jgi:hypothetical protein
MITEKAAPSATCRLCALRVCVACAETLVLMIQLPPSHLKIARDYAPNPLKCSALLRDGSYSSALGWVKISSRRTCSIGFAALKPVLPDSAGEPR